MKGFALVPPVARTKRSLNRGGVVACALLFLLPSLLAVPAAGATVPGGFVDELVASGFTTPRDLALLPSGAWLVTEKAGTVQLVANGSLREVLDISARVKASGNEQGLLGVAPDPDFPSRPYVYFHYDATSGNVIRVSRFTVLNATNNATLEIDASSELILLGDIPDNAPNHNGGTVRFGPDKRLYVSVGEDADPCAAQDLSLLKGKILRLNINDTADPANRSTLVPPDNPFATHMDVNARLVYAYGLRNPFRFAIDPADGLLYIGDVGQNSWEEVDISAGGENFGWPYMEGNHTYRTSTCPGDTSIPTSVRPIYEYPNPGGASVVLSTVYRGVDRPGNLSFPEAFGGNPFFVDFYSGQLRVLRENMVTGAWQLVAGVDATNFATGMAGVPATAVGPDGALWYLASYSDELRRIRHVAPPQIPGPGALPAATVGAPYAYPFQVSGGVAPFTWDLSAGMLPPGTSLAASTGLLSGTPTSNGTFVFTVRVIATDSRWATLDVVLVVRDPLVLVTGALPRAFEGEAYGLNFSATGGLTPYQWNLTSGTLPAGMGLQVFSGRLAGSPSTSGTFDFTLEVSDWEGRLAERPFSLEVVPALEMISATFASGQVFLELKETLQAAGGVPPYNWALESGSLPEGVNLTSAGELGGTPLEPGLFPITVVVEDARGSRLSRLFDLVITPAVGAPPFVSVSFLPDATEGQGISWNLTAAGGYPPFAWALVSGTLPTGLSLNSTGALTGLATEPGSFTFAVQVSDAWNQTDNATFTIHVAALPHSLSLLPVGDVFAAAGSPMTPIEVRWTGENAVEPLVWEATGLPPGVEVHENGTVSGTPGAVGEFNITVIARDSATEPVFSNTTFKLLVPRVDVVARVLPTLEVGTFTSQLLVLPDGYYEATYSVSAGALPGGLELSAAGGLVGTPGAAGNFTFTLRATGPGPADNYDEVEFTVQVNPGPEPPPAPGEGPGAGLFLVLILVIVGALVGFYFSRRAIRRRP